MLLTPALLLLCYQEYTSDFQAKYQKLLVRNLQDLGGKAFLQGSLARGARHPQQTYEEQLWAEPSL